MRVLLVEDDLSIVELLTTVLVKQNYVVDVAEDGEAGWELVKSFSYDLLLLDVMLPKLDGITFCRQLRQEKNQVLVMLLTARDTTTDKLLGLDSGADDYLVKPFNTQELVARMRALLRRRNATSNPVLECGPLRLDPTTRTVMYHNQPLRFSRKEFLLLELFLQNPHRVFSRSTIIDQLWSLGEEPPDEDTIKSHIKNIRRQLRTFGSIDLIETLYGQGYRINPNYATQTQVSADVFSPTATPTPEEKVDQIIWGIWERTKGVSVERVLSLQQALQIFKDSGRLDEEQRQKAVQVAHKLIGSLGTFGFDRGSALAQEIEEALQVERLPSLSLEHLESLVTALYQELTTRTPASNQDDQSAAAPPLSLTSSIQEVAAVPHSNDRRSQQTPYLEGEQPLLLIVDRDQELAAGLAAEAVGWKIRTILATDLVTAHHLVRQQRPDAVLIDVMLTGDLTEGQQFLSQITTLHPTTSCLVFTEHERSQERITLIKAGAQMFLPKPTTPSEALQAVSELLRLPDQSHAKVLLVDDDPQILPLVKSILEEHSIQLTCLEDPTEFWETLKSAQPDLLILDLNMPVLNGLDLCQSVRSDFQWNWLPILFLSGQSDKATLRQLFDAGADDYVSKPICAEELVTHVLNRLKRSRLLRRQSQIDALTGVANRQQATQALGQLLQLASHSQQPVCLTVLDLDYFKQVNDQYGHIQGDRVLRQFGQFLKRKFRLGDVVARWGGEEFVVGLYNTVRADGIERIAEVLEEWRSVKIEVPASEYLQATEAPESISITFSAGIAQYPIDGHNLQMLYRTADAVLYRAKVNGRDRILSTNWQRPASSNTTVDVLLVHPDTEIGKTIQQALETRGYRAQWLEKGQDAIAALKSRSSRVKPHVLLLAQHLVDLTGRAVLEQLGKRILRQFQTIVLLEDADQAEAFQALGANHYLLTPCQPTIITRCLRQVLQS